MQVAITEAMRVVVNAIKEDPSYRAACRANIAMCIIDVQARWGNTTEDSHRIASEAADEFLGILCLERNTRPVGAAIAEKLAAIERGEPV